jgi:pantothenate kinase type III
VLLDGHFLLYFHALLLRFVLRQTCTTGLHNFLSFEFHLKRAIEAAVHTSAYLILHNRTMLATFIPGAVDIGNSRIKILVGEHYFSASFDEPWQEQMQKFFWNFTGKTVMLGLSSVNDTAEELFSLELKKRSNIKSQSLIPLLSRQPFLDISGIQGIGADRVLGMIGALHHDPASIRPVITIDCGTAITINAVNVHRRCLGGAILPGIATQLRSLHESTERLPYIEPAVENVSAGTSTVQAMRIGVVHGAAGAIRFLVERIIADDFEGVEPLVFIAGGNAQLLKQALQPWFIQPIEDTHLVLKGIQAVMAYVMMESLHGSGIRRLNAS